ncbi:MAG: SRPBCC domain-containing protein [Burkholderiaceae bacterium]|jgi:uncharacterized protein YndB with AHSA1/START domain
MTKSTRRGADILAFSVPPVHKVVVVTVSREKAFERFTRDLQRWWPKERHSIGQEQTVFVGMECHLGGRIFERLADGSEHVWGTIVAWNPPEGLSYTWHPGRSPDKAQEIRVGFEALPEGGTRVELVHLGWETLGEQALAARDEYDKGWELVFVHCYTQSLRGSEI